MVEVPDWLLLSGSLQQFFEDESATTRPNPNMFQPGKISNASFDIGSDIFADSWRRT